MSKKTKRYITVMILGVIMNEVLSRAASIFNLPVWLDVTGTALVALVLEPAAGLLVGLMNNFFLSIFIYDNTTLLYYVVSAAVALIVGINMKRNGKIVIKQIVPTILLVIVVSAFLSSGLTIWRNNGIPTSNWEQHYATLFTQDGIHPYLSCFIGVLIVKIYDTIVSAAIVAGAYLLLPKKLKQTEEIEG